MLQRIGALFLCVGVCAGGTADAAKMAFLPVQASGPHVIDGSEITIVGGQEVTLEIIK